MDLILPNIVQKYVSCSNVKENIVLEVTLERRVMMMGKGYFFIPKYRAEISVILLGLEAISCLKLL